MGYGLWNLIWVLSYRSIIRSGCNEGKSNAFDKEDDAATKGALPYREIKTDVKAAGFWIFNSFKGNVEIYSTHWHWVMVNTDQRLLNVQLITVNSITLSQTRPNICHSWKRQTWQINELNWFKSKHVLQQIKLKSSVCNLCDVTNVIVSISKSRLAWFCSVAPSGNVDPSV